MHLPVAPTLVIAFTPSAYINAFDYSLMRERERELALDYYIAKLHVSQRDAYLLRRVIRPLSARSVSFARFNLAIRATITHPRGYYRDLPRIIRLAARRREK